MFSEIVPPDLDNVPKLKTRKDNQYVVDKMNMTVLLICSSISGNGHVEFRQAREHACLVEHCKNERSNVRYCPWLIYGAPDCDATVFDIWKFLLPMDIITTVYRLCYLSFQYMLLLHRTFCSVSFIFLYTFQRKD